MVSALKSLIKSTMIRGAVMAIRLKRLELLAADLVSEETRLSARLAEHQSGDGSDPRPDIAGCRNLWCR